MTVTVNVVDGHADANVCCVATVSTVDGAIITDGSDCTDAGLFDIPETTNLNINLPAVFAGTNGYVSVRCTLPGTFPVSGGSLSSILASIAVSE